MEMERGGGGEPPPSPLFSDSSSSDSDDEQIKTTSFFHLYKSNAKSSSSSNNNNNINNNVRKRGLSLSVSPPSSSSALGMGLSFTNKGSQQTHPQHPIYYSSLPSSFSSKQQASFIPLKIQNNTTSLSSPPPSSSSAINTNPPLFFSPQKTQSQIIHEEVREIVEDPVQQYSNSSTIRKTVKGNRKGSVAVTEFFDEREMEDVEDIGGEFFMDDDDDIEDDNSSESQGVQPRVEGEGAGSENEGQGKEAWEMVGSVESSNNKNNGEEVEDVEEEDVIQMMGMEDVGFKNTSSNSVAGGTPRRGPGTAGSVNASPPRSKSPSQPSIFKWIWRS
jgi:hypothetical protein